MPVFQDSFVLAAEFHDFDSLAEASAGWDVQFSQVKAGRFSGQGTIASTDQVQIVHEVWNSGLLVTGGIPANTTAICFFRAAPPRLRNMRVEFDPHLTGVGGTPGHEIHLIAPGPSEIVTFAIEHRAMESHVRTAYGVDCATLGRDWWLRPEPGTPRCAARAEALLTLQAALVSGAAATPAARQRIQQAALAIAFDGLDIVPGSEPASLATRRALARRAEDVLRARMDAPPSLAELCGLVGASQRTLHLAFAESFGMAPKPYLRALRLNAARRRLRRGEGTVTQVAADLGFFHFARFSGEYRELFAELPSDTLRRARAEAGVAA